jgi:hypothetical protein
LGGIIWWIDYYFPNLQLKINTYEIMNTFLLMAGSAVVKVCAKGGHHAGHFFHGHHFPGFWFSWHICHTIMVVVIACIVGFLLWKFGQFLAGEWRAYRERKWQLKDANKEK